MNFLAPLVASVLQTSSLITDKAILSIKNVNYKMYTAVSFPLIFLVNLIVFLVVRPPFAIEIFWGINGLLMLLSVGISVTTNILLYRGLGHDNLGEIQTMDLFHQVPVILVASIVFEDERNFVVILAALIASAAIFWSHWDHHRLKIKSQTWPYLLWLCLADPINIITTKVLLQSLNPITFAMVRAGLRALVFLCIFGKNIHKIPSRGWLLFLMTNICTSIAWIFFFSSYQSSGIVFTTLLLCLQPLLVYIGSLIVLREKFHWKKALAFIIILACIVPSQLLK